jgi:two-component system chemotaxis sensor kinase CheA
LNKNFLAWRTSLSRDAPHLKEFAADLEKLALKAVMLAENDVPALGAFLNDLDSLKEKVAVCQSPEATSLVEQMEEVADRLALNEIKAAAQALEVLGLGVSLLQKWVQKGDWPGSEEEWHNYCRLLEELGLATPYQGESVARSQTMCALLSEDPELLTNFLTEAKEHLEGIETRLIHLEQHPEDLEAVNAIFRPFHTIKGVAGFLNLAQVQEMSHEMESLLEDLRSGRLTVSSDLIDTVLAGVDLLKEMLEDLRCASAEPRDHRELHLEPLKEKISALRAAPSPSPRLGEILVSRGDLQPEDLAASLACQQAQEPSRPLGELLVEEGKVPPKKVAQALVQQLSDARAGGDMAAPATIKVDLAKVDLLVDLMGELVIIQSQVRQNPTLAAVADQKLVRDLGQMSRITSDLQRISMSLRMVPIGATFRKMVRLVRDLSHKVGKLVNLRLEGEDTEIDRNMVEAIYDPLVHLVRNALDHGLETPEERQAQGKPAEGQLWLRAYQKGGSIIIEIEDDGWGLNREAILARARERGLVAPHEHLTPAQMDSLIFEPGFSTTQEVTEVSGRGVGLDVVKQIIERLRGKIEVASHFGEGARFTLRLPLTLAIIDGLVIRVGEERYILPSVSVRETLHPAPEDYFTVQGKGELIQVREQLVPLVRLHRLFAINGPDVRPDQALVLVVEHEGESRALLVDEILDKQEVVIKSLGLAFQNLRGVAGGTILGDGRVGLILELGGVFQMQHDHMPSINSTFQEK